MLGRAIDAILTLNPWIEVAVKCTYWRFGWLHRLLGVLHRRWQRPQEAAAIAVDPTLLPRVLQQLRDFGVQEGDLLIVHSSMGNLKKLGASPAALIAALQSLIGARGTLAMPTFPVFANAPQGLAAMNDAACGEELVYNVATTPSWTGVIGTTLQRMEGAIRSRHPLNTLTALGPQAAAMMAYNLDGEHPLACGRNSPWYYAVEHGAKVVALGTDLTRSLTMLHVSEDAWETAWPIANWYRERRFHVIDGAFERHLVCPERRPQSSNNLASHTLRKDMLAAGVLRAASIGGVTVELLEARALIDFLAVRKHTGYPYFTLQPRKVR